MAPLSTHIAYLQRDGTTRDGSPAQMFDANGDRADQRTFAERCKGDRHHFRIIVSPEDAAELTDLRAFTRDLAKQMEADLGTRLDWVAVDHWNTDNPHVHMLVRGVTETGQDLVIARDYIGHGLRSRAEELATIELGPRQEQRIARSLEKDVEAERWTGLDAALRLAADETGQVDLRPGRRGPDDPQIRRLLVARAQQLEAMGLAEPDGPGRWRIAQSAEQRLRDLGKRGDIIRTMHKALGERSVGRAAESFVIEGDQPTLPIVGRLVAKGLHNELTGPAYAVIDATDGRAHHVRLPSLTAIKDSPAIGGIVEVRKVGAAKNSTPTLVLATRSDFDISTQIKAPGATWLDHRLIERGASKMTNAGFGGETLKALDERIDHLAREGLAKRFGERIVLVPGLLETLRRRELDAVGARLSQETGLAYRAVANGDKVAGTCRQRLTLSSGRFVMIDNGMGFSLVPWSKNLERQLGRHVSGVVDQAANHGLNSRRRSLGI